MRLVVLRSSHSPGLGAQLNEMLRHELENLKAYVARQVGSTAVAASLLAWRCARPRLCGV